jgi:cyanophycinase-like exopeptidase
VSGPIGLHGGGEYQAGDEPFLDALLASAAGSVGTRLDSADDVAGHGIEAAIGTIRVVIVPTAAGRGQPDAAAATGQAAFERRSAETGRPVSVAVARIVDASSAGDPDLIDQLASADLIHLPGGDPDLIPAILRDTPALAAMREAWLRGAVIAGASAGAMALGEWTWTPDGGIHGLGFVRGLAVVPHYHEYKQTEWQETLDALAPGRIGYLGLDERTGVIALPNGRAGRDWRVAGPGAAYWFARGVREPLVGHHGDVLHLPI